MQDETHAQEALPRLHRLRYHRPASPCPSLPAPLPALLCLTIALPATLRAYAAASGMRSHQHLAPAGFCVKGPDCKFGHPNFDKSTDVRYNPMGRGGGFGGGFSPRGGGASTPSSLPSAPRCPHSGTRGPSLPPLPALDRIFAS